MEPSRGLYARLLGDSWHELAAPVRCAHASGSAHGTLRIVRGGGVVGRALAGLMRLPREHPAAQTRLTVTRRDDGEDWHRTFGDRRLDTRQYPTGDGWLAERFGLLEFRFRLEPDHGSLLFRQVGARFVLGPLRMRLPAAFAPTVDAREDPAGARDVSIHARVVLPLVGPVLTYDGLMRFEEARR